MPQSTRISDCPEGKMDTVLEIQGLTKIYSNGRGIHDISLSLREGEVLGLLGPNGSGKTTVMKCTAGLCRPNAGYIEIFGENALENHAKAMEHVGVLIEQPAFYGNLTARENLLLAARLYPNVTEDRVDRVLKAVRLFTYRKDMCSRFSLGMKQRLGIALALLSEPKLVLLDEPANGLDIEGTVEVREIILNLAREKGVSFVVSSHLSAELEKLCTRATVLSEGAMLAEDTMESVLSQAPSLEDYYLEKVREGRTANAL